jgi:hypothetical protein
MVADRLVKLLLGTIAVLLVSLFVQIMVKYPAPAQGAIPVPGTDKVYDVRLITQIKVPEIKEVVTLGNSEKTGLHFAVRTKDTVYVYRCDYYSNARQ